VPETPTTKDTTASAWIAIATLLRPQGRRGELLSDPLSDLPDLFQPGRETYVVPKGVTTPPANAKPIVLEESWQPTGKNAGRIVLKLAGCNSINDAELLAGQQLLVPAASLPALDAETFFVGDLVGCAFYDGDTQIGTIVDVQFAMSPDGRTRLEDAAPLLGVETTPGDDPVLIPFVRVWLVAVDIAAHRVTMNLPGGFFDDFEPPIGDDSEDSDSE
jgi:16S rRNA processing protein RimM